jgi:hypothetical protein
MYMEVANGIPFGLHWSLYLYFYVKRETDLFVVALYNNNSIV